MKTGIQPSTWSKPIRPTCSAAVLEEEDEQPVRRADREQVEEDRLQRQQQRPEGAHEQQVGEHEHAEHEPREGAVGDVEEVDPARQAAARVDRHVLGEARAGMISPRSRSTKSIASGEPYSCFPITPTLKYRRVGSTCCGVKSKRIDATSGSERRPDVSRDSDGAIA